MENKCESCYSEFGQFENAVLVNDRLYHDYCVTLHPSGYVVFIGDEYIGESENDEGQWACEYIDFNEEEED